MEVEVSVLDGDSAVAALSLLSLHPGWSCLGFSVTLQGPAPPRLPRGRATQCLQPAGLMYSLSVERFTKNVQANLATGWHDAPQHVCLCDELYFPLQEPASLHLTCYLFVLQPGLWVRRKLYVVQLLSYCRVGTMFLPGLILSELKLEVYRNIQFYHVKYWACFLLPWDVSPLTLLVFVVQICTQSFSLET